MAALFIDCECYKSSPYVDHWKVLKEFERLFAPQFTIRNFYFDYEKEFVLSELCNDLMKVPPFGPEYVVEPCKVQIFRDDNGKTVYDNRETILGEVMSSKIIECGLSQCRNILVITNNKNVLNGVRVVESKGVRVCIISNAGKLDPTFVPYRISDQDTNKFISIDDILARCTTTSSPGKRKSSSFDITSDKRLKISSDSHVTSNKINTKDNTEHSEKSNTSTSTTALNPTESAKRSEIIEYLKEERKNEVRQSFGGPEVHIQVCETKLFVSNALIEAANGEYSYVGVMNKAGYFQKSGDSGGSWGKYMIYRYRLSNNTFKWFLSFVAKNVKIGSTDDRCLYFCDGQMKECPLPVDKWFCLTARFRYDTAIVVTSKSPDDHKFTVLQSPQDESPAQSMSKQPQQQQQQQQQRLVEFPVNKKHDQAQQQVVVQPYEKQKQTAHGEECAMNVVTNKDYDDRDDDAEFRNLPARGLILGMRTRQDDRNRYEKDTPDSLRYLRRTTLTIVNSGVADVNGVYEYAGIMNGAGIYEKDVGRDIYVVYRCQMKSREFPYLWFLSRIGANTPYISTPGGSVGYHYFYSLDDRDSPTPKKQWYSLHTKEVKSTISVTVNMLASTSMDKNAHVSSSAMLLSTPRSNFAPQTEKVKDSVASPELPTRSAQPVARSALSSQRPAPTPIHKTNCEFDNGETYLETTLETTRASPTKTTTRKRPLEDAIDNSTNKNQVDRFGREIQSKSNSAILAQSNEISTSMLSTHNGSATTIPSTGVAAAEKTATTTATSAATMEVKPVKVLTGDVLNTRKAIRRARFKQAKNLDKYSDKNQTEHLLGTSVSVANSLVKIVNGDYHYAGLMNNAPYYEKQDADGKGRYSLYKWAMQSIYAIDTAKSTCHSVQSQHPTLIFKWFLAYVVGSALPGRSSDQLLYYSDALEDEPRGPWHSMSQDFMVDNAVTVNALPLQHESRSDNKLVTNSVSANTNQRPVHSSDQSAAPSVSNTNNNSISSANVLPASEGAVDERKMASAKQIKAALDCLLAANATRDANKAGTTLATESAAVNNSSMSNSNEVTGSDNGMATSDVVTEDDWQSLKSEIQHASFSPISGDEDEGDGGTAAYTERQRLADIEMLKEARKTSEGNEFDLPQWSHLSYLRQSSLLVKNCCKKNSKANGEFKFWRLMNSAACYEMQTNNGRYVIYRCKLESKKQVWFAWFLSYIRDVDSSGQRRTDRKDPGTKYDFNCYFSPCSGSPVPDQPWQNMDANDSSNIAVIVRNAVKPATILAGSQQQQQQQSQTQNQQQLQPSEFQFAPPTPRIYNNQSSGVGFNSCSGAQHQTPSFSHQGGGSTPMFSSTPVHQPQCAPGENNNKRTNDFVVPSQPSNRSQALPLMRHQSLPSESPHTRQTDSLDSRSFPMQSGRHADRYDRSLPSESPRIRQTDTLDSRSFPMQSGWQGDSFDRSLPSESPRIRQTDSLDSRSFPMQSGHHVDSYDRSLPSESPRIRQTDSLDSRSFPMQSGRHIDSYDRSLPSESPRTRQSDTLDSRWQGDSYDRSFPSESPRIRQTDALDSRSFPMQSGRHIDSYDRSLPSESPRYNNFENDFDVQASHHFRSKDRFDDVDNRAVVVDNRPHHNSYHNYDSYDSYDNYERQERSRDRFDYQDSSRDFDRQQSAFEPNNRFTSRSDRDLSEDREYNRHNSGVSTKAANTRVNTKAIASTSVNASWEKRQEAIISYLHSARLAEDLSNDFDRRPPQKYAYLEDCSITVKKSTVGDGHYHFAGMLNGAAMFASPLKKGRYCIYKCRLQSFEGPRYVWFLSYTDSKCVPGGRKDDNYYYCEDKEPDHLLPEGGEWLSMMRNTFHKDESPSVIVRRGNASPAPNRSTERATEGIPHISRAQSDPLPASRAEPKFAGRDPNLAGRYDGSRADPKFADRYDSQQRYPVDERDNLQSERHSEKSYTPKPASNGWNNVANKREEQAPQQKHFSAANTVNNSNNETNGKSDKNPQFTQPQAVNTKQLSPLVSFLTKMCPQISIAQTERAVQLCLERICSQPGADQILTEKASRLCLDYFQSLYNRQQNSNNAKKTVGRAVDVQEFVEEYDVQCVNILTALFPALSADEIESELWDVFLKVEELGAAFVEERAIIPVYQHCQLLNTLQRMNES